MAKKSALSKALAKRGKKSAKKSIKQAAPQSESYSVEKDKKEKAKPAGYRFKGLSNFKTPTKKDIAADAGKPKSKRKTYFENRKDKSDVKPSKGFAKGGRAKKDKSEKVDPVVRMHWRENDLIQTGVWIEKFDGKIDSKEKIKDFFELMHYVVDKKSATMFDIEKSFDDYADDKGNKLFPSNAHREALNGIRKQIEDYAKANDISLYYLDIDVRKDMYPTKRKFKFGGTADLLVNAHEPQNPTEVQSAVFEEGGMVKDFRKKADSLINKYSGKIKTEKSIENFLRDIHEKLELNFHPDDRFNSYMDENSKDLFTKVQSKRLDRIMDDIFKVADKLKIDVYEISLKYQQELLKRKGIMKEGGPILPEDMTQADVMEHGGETIPKEKPAATLYWKGDLAEYTGKTETIHGGLFYEIKLLEGHLKDELKWTQRAPSENPIVETEPEVTVEPEVEVKIETMQKATIPNIESASYAENLIDFMGTNLEGKKLPNGDYVVLSFLYYPIWFYCAKDQKWYGNSDKYNSVTAMHISQSRPTPNAEMLSCPQLLNQMNQGIERYEAGGSILVRQLYPLPYDNTVIAHQ